MRAPCRRAYLDKNNTKSIGILFSVMLNACLYTFYEITCQLNSGRETNEIKVRRSLEYVFRFHYGHIAVVDKQNSSKVATHIDTLATVPLRPFWITLFCVTCEANLAHPAKESPSFLVLWSSEN